MNITRRIIKEHILDAIRDGCRTYIFTLKPVTDAPEEIDFAINYLQDQYGPHLEIEEVDHYRYLIKINRKFWDKVICVRSSHLTEKTVLSEPCPLCPKDTHAHIDGAGDLEDYIQILYCLRLKHVFLFDHLRKCFLYAPKDFSIIVNDVLIKP
jgi:hypothetical protein